LRETRALVASGKDGEDQGGAAGPGGVLQGSVAFATGCAQLQRVLENCGVVVPESSDTKGRAPSDVGDGQQAPLPRVELGLRYHQLNEFQWRRVDTTCEHDGSKSVVVLEEELVTVYEGLDMGDGHLPLLPIAEVVQRFHCRAGAARVRVRSGTVCLSLV